MGPLINERRVLGVEHQIHLARLAGGTVLTGGSRMLNSGNFFAPTVVVNVPDTCPLGRDEIFGPVAVVSEFDTLDEVIARANSTMAGLAAYAFCGSARDATLLANRLLAGMVGINTTRVASFATPFGGLRESGWGRVGGPEGIQACLDMKLISQARN